MSMSIYQTEPFQESLNYYNFLLLQEHIQTNHGSVSVAIYGDHHDKPAFITYPYIALNCKFYNHTLLLHIRIMQHCD